MISMLAVAAGALICAVIGSGFLTAAQPDPNRDSPATPPYLPHT